MPRPDAPASSRTTAPTRAADPVVRRAVAPSDGLLAGVLGDRAATAELAALLGAAAETSAGIVVIGADRFLPDAAFDADAAFDPVGRRAPRVDPSVVALELARAEPDLGVLIAVAPTRDHPYNTARRILSIDHLTGGRAGVLLGGPDRGTVPDAIGTAWTGAAEDDALLAEYAAVLRALWSTWPIESIVADRASGVFADPTGIRRLDHDGAWRIGGALTTPTGPQGEPVLSGLAGVSAPGLAADLDVVVEPVRVDDLDHLRTAADRPGSHRPSPANSSATATTRPGTLRSRLGLPDRRADLLDRAPAFSASAASTSATTTGGTR